MKDYYKILGISQNACQKEIDEAYRKLAIKYHPDKNIGNPKSDKKFKEIQEAYENIKNSKNYVSFQFKDKNSVDDIFDNIFSKFFGDQKKENNSSKVRIKISLEESYKGCSKTIEVDKHLFCESCQGTGGSSWENCPRCESKGFVYSDGLFSIKSACSFCSGRGSNIKEKCKSCHGKGFIISEKKQLEIQIPPGIEDETQIRIANEGSGGGDLYVMVNIQKNNYLKREKQNVICDFEVPYYTLILGGKKTINLFDKEIEVSIKPRTKTGSKLVIKNQGFPLIHNNQIKGDLILTIQLKIPDKINQEYKNLLNKLDNFENKIL